MLGSAHVCPMYNYRLHTACMYISNGVRMYIMTNTSILLLVFCAARKKKKKKKKHLETKTRIKIWETKNLTNVIENTINFGDEKKYFCSIKKF